MFNRCCCYCFSVVGRLSTALNFDKKLYIQYHIYIMPNSIVLENDIETICFANYVDEISEHYILACSTLFVNGLSLFESG